ncbi:expressed unknown protein [Seminavis robusta]|uniref:Uncharacterized protein n=1 Tax=Seminavis robusta TaxID=568900 RepID=A0A9N8DAD7_9STRA|nr:expressed unknown protein [Seminavis robusta]|eukprot:Sro15_g011130.1 n/a (357) ;mRNA; f:81012-82435
MNRSSGRRLVDGQIVHSDAFPSSSFSYRRFLFVAILATVMIVTNPANELFSKTMDIVEQVTGRKSRQHDLSDWDLNKIMDPPISVTNYGLFTLEERHAKVVVSLLTKSVSCPYFDQRKGSFCSAVAKNLCHGNPLVYHPKSYAYTAHRTICFILVGTALLAFCFNGSIPPFLTQEPFMRALLTCFSRKHFSLLSLAMDLVNCSLFVYPALERMERIVPTLQDGKPSLALGVPEWTDFAFYAIVMVLFLGGGSNSLANFFFTKDPCFGFDTTVAAAVAYCSAIPSKILPFANQPAMLTPQTVFWGYLPITALLGGTPSYLVAWLIAGSLGVILAQYHTDNQSVLLAFKGLLRSAFSN